MGYYIVISYFILNESLYQICMRYYELQRQVSPFGAGYTMYVIQYRYGIVAIYTWLINGVTNVAKK